MDELFVDPNQMVRDAIVSALKPYARLASEGWGFYADPNFDTLDAQQRMLVVLLGRKASNLAHKVESDRLSKEELCTLSAVGEGTYRPYAPRLERAGLIRREGNEIWIPEEAVVRASNVVLGRLSLPDEGGARTTAPRKAPAATEQDHGNETLRGHDEGERDSALQPPKTAQTAAKRSRKKSNGPWRARSMKDFQVLYSGKIDLSSFPHPDDVGDPVRLSLLPLLIARDGYNMEGLPLKEIAGFLREKYGRVVQEDEIESALNPVRGKYVDCRFDSHMDQNIYCLLEQGRGLLVPKVQSAVSKASADGIAAMGGE